MNHPTTVAKRIIYPHMVTSSWFRTWTIECGNEQCRQVFWRWSAFAVPKCPFCGRRNHLNLVSYP